MKLVWILNTIRFSAVESSVCSTFQRLKAINPTIKLHILSFHDGRYDMSQTIVDEMASNGVDLTIIKFKTIFGIPRPTVFFEYLKFLLAYKPNVIHVYCERFSFAILFLARILRVHCIRTVCHIHTLADSPSLKKMRRFSKIFQRYLLRKLGVIFLSHSETNSIHEREFYRNDKVKPIFCAYDNLKYNANYSTFFHHSSRKNVLNFCTVGGNWWYKNYKSIINALCMLKEHYPNYYKDITYYQIGPNNEELKKYAEACGVLDSCCFLGAITDWRPYAANCTFFFAPSFEEGMNLAVAESSALGLIPVLTKNKCLNEHVRLGCVEWFNSPSPNDIFEKILHLFELESSTIQLLSSMAAKNSYSYYSADVISAKLYDIYESIA